MAKKTESGAGGVSGAGVGAANAPTNAPAAVGDPGSIIDHIFRIVSAVKTKNYAEAARLTLDVLAHAVSEWQNLPPMPVMFAAGERDVEGLAAELESVVSSAGGQPAMGRSPQAAATKLDWSTLLPMLLQLLQQLFQKKAG